MTPAYILICLLNFGIVVWVLYKVVRLKPFPPNSDDDDGGILADYTFPTFDLPSGSGLDDLLVDRPPKDWVEGPAKPVRQLVEH